MGLYTDWNSAPKILDQGKSRRVVSYTSGEPIVTFESTIGPDQKPTIEKKESTWYKINTDFSASFHIPGLTLAAAQAGATALVSNFTHSKAVWRFGLQEVKETIPVDQMTPTGQQEEKVKFVYGWFKSPENTTACESEIAVVPMGGKMYMIQVQAHVTDESYTDKPATMAIPSYPACFSVVPDGGIEPNGGQENG